MSFLLGFSDSPEKALPDYPKGIFEGRRLVSLLSLCINIHLFDFY